MIPVPVGDPGTVVLAAVALFVASWLLDAFGAPLVGFLVEIAALGALGFAAGLFVLGPELGGLFAAVPLIASRRAIEPEEADVWH